MKLDSLRCDAEKDVKKLGHANRSLEKRLAETTTKLDVAKQSIDAAEKRTEEEKHKIQAAEKAKDEAEAKLADHEQADMDSLFEDPVEEERQALDANLSNTEDALKQQKTAAAEERQAFKARLGDLQDGIHHRRIEAQEAYQALEMELNYSQDELSGQGVA